jgi:hypothetical protein
MTGELRTVEDVYCLDDDDCDQATGCTECPAFICPDHSNEFTTCRDDSTVFHHVGCAERCPYCIGRDQS